MSTTKIRTVKPELFRHHGLFMAEKETGLPLRLAFIALFSCCDREGRFRWRSEELKLDILPYDNIDFSSVLEALVDSGFIIQYKCEDKFYGCIPSWHQHQRINIREPENQLPGPPRNQANIQGICHELINIKKFTGEKNVKNTHYKT